MVVNKKGGNKGKKMARKHMTTNKTSTFLRISNDPLEIYAITTKMLGNNMFHCIDTRGVLRLGHIRRKFSGRGKHGNLITMGTWVLVGLREYENTSENKPNKLENCDILEVYTTTEKDRLRDTVDENWTTLINNDQSAKIIASSSANAPMDDLIFSNDAEITNTTNNENVNTISLSLSIGEGKKNEDEGDDEDAFDFDDI